MPVGLYEASVPVFLRYLDRLGGLVRCAQAHARRFGLENGELLDARLAPDMLPFASQVGIAANFSLRACFPLVGRAIPDCGDIPHSFEGLSMRLDHVVALLRTLESGEFEHAETRILESRAGNALVSLPSPAFMFEYALPNFFFHLTAAYAILRSHGVVLGKEQFDGFHSYEP